MERTSALERVSAAEASRWSKVASSMARERAFCVKGISMSSRECQLGLAALYYAPRLKRWIAGGRIDLRSVTIIIYGACPASHRAAICGSHTIAFSFGWQVEAKSIFHFWPSGYVIRIFQAKLVRHPDIFLDSSRDIDLQIHAVNSLTSGPRT